MIKTTKNQDIKKQLIASLSWQLDQGINETLDLNPEKKTTVKSAVTPNKKKAINYATRTIQEFIADAKNLARESSDVAKLTQAVESFKGCEEIRRHSSRTVFFDGNPEANLLIVGEAPGAEEDKQGKPFVGASGRLLSNALKSININGREDYFISNSVFWRPPGNRKPTNSEILMCVPFVYRLIEIAKPKVILLLGASSVNCLFPDNQLAITHFRKQWHNIKDIPAIATYHPAFYLRQPSRKANLWQDLMLLEQKLTSLKSPEN